MININIEYCLKQVEKDGTLCNCELYNFHPDKNNKHSEKCSIYLKAKMLSEKGKFDIFTGKILSPGLINAFAKTLKI